ncbi:NECB-like protein, partial [Mya arenaria]
IERLAQSYMMYPASPLKPQSAANGSDEQQADQWNASNDMLLCPPYFDKALGIDDSWIRRGIVVGVPDAGINANNTFIRGNMIERLAQSYMMYPASPLKPQSAANGSDEQQADQWNASNDMLLCPPYFDKALGIDDSWIKYNVTGRGIVVGVTDAGINANNTFIRGNMKSDLSYNFVDNITQTGPTSSLRTGPVLSARDVKHILIESSSHLGIQATSEFMHNKDGKYYHPNLGFGLPDCNQMIGLGRHWKQLKPLCTEPVIHDKDQDWYVRVLADNTFCNITACIEKMEEVLFKIEFVYSEQHHMKLLAKSPTLGIDDSWIKYNVTGRGIVVGVTDAGINANNTFIRGNMIARRGERTWMIQGMDSAIISRALAFRRDAIQIYSNSWAPPRAFMKSDFYVEEVLTEGMNKGRHGLGTVYVFPAGQPGSGFANHIASITVACLGVNGSVADVSAVNAATLVSVFCNGRKRKDQRMITVGEDETMCGTSIAALSYQQEIHDKDQDWYVRVLADNTFCNITACIEKMEEV